MLSDLLIRQAMRSGQLVIDPAPHDSQLQPVSVDLLLGDIAEPCDCEDRGWDEDESRYERPDRWTLLPGEFRLASTLEWVEMPLHLVGVLAGKSSRAREGLQVEAAGLVDPNFKGQPTLELINFGHNPLRLTRGIPICQISFHQVMGKVLRPYDHPGLRSRYQGQSGPTASRTHPPNDDSHLPPPEEAESNR